MNIYLLSLVEDYYRALKYLKEGNLEKAKFWLINIRDNRIRYKFYICV